ncbi:MAG: bifunctional pyr operon transcriptional regulator/uracil phosphoribosyltransferase [Candidatus Marinimicrobia bacterium]|nr:bifunctional pyr operon transcriptional regulator/uracil phosphoribosyltransferase [Candidatus Neomarinimicrobiota bacterium]|tara:strand:+ start:3092 stop:3643 length:552 start_codon:yes stop_codon:yes gene_type:complete
MVKIEETRKKILDSKDIDNSIKRLAYELAERFKEINDIVIIGIRTRGEFIALRLAELLKDISGIKIPTGFLDVTFYRDDFRERLIQPQIKGSSITFSIDGKIVILTDDVLFTGRTIRAAMNEIMDYGRPSSLSLAVLIDRGHREMPIRADFVGKNIPTSNYEHIIVRLAEIDNKDGVYLIKRS